MLRSLYVKNLALIEETEVEFTDGLNILSGETGAGKSIIIGSINIALGARVQKDIIRHEDEAALVELVFDMKDEHREILKRLDLDEMKDGTLVISRKINKGRSISKINGETVSASALKEVTQALIDIHGQHDHQSLLQKQKHLEILDEFARTSIKDLKQKTAEDYKKYRQLEKQLSDFHMDEEERLRKVDFLKYEIAEIEEAQLKPGEDSSLEAEYKTMSKGKEVVASMSFAYQLIGENTESSVAELSGRAARELASVSDVNEEVESIYKQMLDIEDMSRDVSRQMEHYIEEMGYDEEHASEVEERLDLWNRMKNRYGQTYEDICNYRDAREKELLTYVHYEEEREKIKKELEWVGEKLTKDCMLLSEKRKKAAKGLEQKIIESLADLNFLDVRFEIKFTQLKDFTQNGLDEVEYLISTNPGEPIRPLIKVASGGELSRIMLAIKTILAGMDSIDCLIFDEIDTGISGRTAQMVAQKMACLSKNSQIICITHLPQIASMADGHFLIEKHTENGMTVSNIQMLNRKQSIEELARMLGGAEVTKQVLANAEEMKELADKVKIE